MKSRSSDLNKITKIISISNDYLAHRKNLTKVKGLVDHSNTKRNRDVSDYLNRKASYRQAYQSQAYRKLEKDNQKIVSRIQNITDKRGGDSRASSRSRTSCQRSFTQQVSSYKTRRNFMKASEIKKQNEKISQRVKNSHFKDGLSPKTYLNNERQRKQYKQICSKHSSRSKSQLMTAMSKINGSSKQLPFLPRLPSKRYTKHQH